MTNIISNKKTKSPNVHFIFAFIMCYLPLIGILRVPVCRIWQMGGILLFIFLPVSTLIVVWTGVTPNVTLFPIMPVFFFIYLRTVDTSWYKALTVYLTVYLIVISLFCLLFSAALFGILYRPRCV